MRVCDRCGRLTDATLGGMCERCHIERDALEAQQQARRKWEEEERRREEEERRKEAREAAMEEMKVVAKQRVKEIGGKKKEHYAWLKQLLSLLLEYGNNLFFIPSYRLVKQDLTATMSAGARSCLLPSTDIALAFLDTTVFPTFSGPGHSGLLFGCDGIYYRNVPGLILTPPQVGTGAIAYKEFPRRTFSAHWVRHVSLGNSQFVSLGMNYLFANSKIARLLNQIKQVVVTSPPPLSDAELRDTLMQSEPLAISARSLRDEFLANKVRAREIYAGRVCRITGTIAHIEETTIRLEGMLSHYALECHVIAQDRQHIMTLSRGQTIVIVGVCRGFSEDIVIDPCIFAMSDEDGSLQMLEQDSETEPDSQSIPVAPEAVPVTPTPVAAVAVPVAPPTQPTPVAPEAVPVTPMSIRFSCPSCQHALSAPSDKAGVLTKCRYCKNPVTIPQPS